MSDRYLFIDFDGVVNALSPKSLADHWGEIDATVLNGFPIHWAPEVVAAIEAMSNAGVRVIWLTTWCADTSLFGALSFQPHPYIGGDHFDSRHGSWTHWWKFSALVDYVATLPDDALIGWCDDDLDGSASVDPNIQTFIAQERVHSISPSSWLGLTKEHIASLCGHFGVEMAVTP